MKLFLILLLILLFHNFINLSSQTVCPDDFQWYDDTVNETIGSYYTAQVSYKYRTTNNNNVPGFEVKIYWNTLYNNIPILGTKTVKKILESNLVSDIIPKDQQTYKVLILFESECNVTVTLDLFVSSEIILACCDENYPSPIQPIIIEYQGIAR